jgi:hypothetical protein
VSSRPKPDEVPVINQVVAMVFLMSGVIFDAWRIAIVTRWRTRPEDRTPVTVPGQSISGEREWIPAPG